MKDKDNRVPKDPDQSLLDSIRIAAPCTADWNSMTGDERIKFCGMCKKNVYNISEMSRAEAADFIRESEGKACIRMYQRKDGTVITDNCPVGLRKLRDRSRAIIAACASAFAWIGLPGSADAQDVEDSNPTTAIEIQKRHAKRLRVTKALVVRKNPDSRTHMMGAPPPVLPAVPANGKIEILQGGDMAIDETPVEQPPPSNEKLGGVFTSTACTVSQSAEPFKLVVVVSALAATGVAALIAWRRKKASLWMLGTIVAVILVAAGFVWGLSGSILDYLAPNQGGGLS